MRRAALVLALSVLGCESSDVDPMELQQRYKPYDPIDRFDGRSMRPPVPGTVPRERALESPAVRAGFDAKGEVAKIPIPVTTELVALGRKRFDVSCAPCHGPLGNGQSVVAAQMSLRPPPTLLDAKLRAMPDGRIFRTISEGYGIMPSYGQSLAPHERWAIVAYVRALQIANTAKLDDVPEDARSQLEEKAP